MNYQSILAMVREYQRARGERREELRQRIAQATDVERLGSTGKRSTRTKDTDTPEDFTPPWGAE